MYGTQEQVAHVFRRLGLGAHPGLAAETGAVSDAIAAALDLTDPPWEFPAFETPTTREDALEPRKIAEPLAWWAEAATQPTRLIEERLTWFWLDHFATSLRKLPIPYVLWQQLLTIRQHATGNFASLLKAMSNSPAMLGYLDGIHNRRGAINENFAREVMELHTLGTGHYTQTDVAEAARAFTGWTVNVPFAQDMRRLVPDGVENWEAFFVTNQHDSGTKTLLGFKGTLDMDGALDVLLDHPATRPRIAAKLFKEIVGLDADASTTDRLADAFADYDILALVEAIVAEPVFVSDLAIRSKVRTPFERLVTMLQAFGLPRTGTARHVEWLFGVGFLPFSPPNPAGYPSGPSLLGPHAVVHGFDLTRLVDPRDLPDDPFIALGIFEPLPATQAAVSQITDPATRLAVVINSPEMMLT